MKHDDVIGEEVPEEEALVARQSVMKLVGPLAFLTWPCCAIHLNLRGLLPSISKGHMQLLAHSAPCYSVHPMLRGLLASTATDDPSRMVLEHTEH